MKFDLNNSIDLLGRTPAVFRALFSGLSDDFIFANEGPETWSAFAILTHLIHCEKDDWIPRSRLILSDDPDKNFPPFDISGMEKAGAGKTFEQLLEDFAQLRAENLAELKSWNLDEEKLDRKGIHPTLGPEPVSLRQLLASWTAHDMNHLNQASRVLVRQYKTEVGPWVAYFKLMK